MTTLEPRQEPECSSPQDEGCTAAVGRLAISEWFALDNWSCLPDRVGPTPMLYASIAIAILFARPTAAELPLAPKLAVFVS